MEDSLCYSSTGSLEDKMVKDIRMIRNNSEIESDETKSVFEVDKEFFSTNLIEGDELRLQNRRMRKSKLNSSQDFGDNLLRILKNNEVGRIIENKQLNLHRATCLRDRGEINPKFDGNNIVQNSYIKNQPKSNILKYEIFDRHSIRWNKIQNPPLNRKIAYSRYYRSCVHIKKRSLLPALKRSSKITKIHQPPMSFLLSHCLESISFFYLGNNGYKTVSSSGDLSKYFTTHIKNCWVEETSRRPINFIEYNKENNFQERHNNLNSIVRVSSSSTRKSALSANKVVNSREFLFPSLENLRLSERSKRNEILWKRKSTAKENECCFPKERNFQLESKVSSFEHNWKNCFSKNALNGFLKSTQKENVNEMVTLELHKENTSNLLCNEVIPKVFDSDYSSPSAVFTEIIVKESKFPMGVRFRETKLVLPNSRAGTAKWIRFDDLQFLENRKFIALASFPELSERDLFKFLKTIQFSGEKISSDIKTRQEKFNSQECIYQNTSLSKNVIKGQSLVTISENENPIINSQNFKKYLIQINEILEVLIHKEFTNSLQNLEENLETKGLSELRDHSVCLNEDSSFKLLLRYDGEKGWRTSFKSLTHILEDMRPRRLSFLVNSIWRCFSEFLQKRQPIIIEINYHKFQLGLYNNGFIQEDIWPTENFSFLCPRISSVQVINYKNKMSLFKHSKVFGFLQQTDIIHFSAYSSLSSTFTINGVLKVLLPDLDNNVLISLIHLMRYSSFKTKRNFEIEHFPELCQGSNHYYNLESNVKFQKAKNINKCEFRDRGHFNLPENTRGTSQIDEGLLRLGIENESELSQNCLFSKKGNRVIESQEECIHSDTLSKFASVNIIKQPLLEEFPKFVSQLKDTNVIHLLTCKSIYNAVLPITELPEIRLSVCQNKCGMLTLSTLSASALPTPGFWKSGCVSEVSLFSLPSPRVKQLCSDDLRFFFKDERELFIRFLRKSSKDNDKIMFNKKNFLQVAITQLLKLGRRLESFPNTFKENGNDSEEIPYSAPIEIAIAHDHSYCKIRNANCSILMKTNINEMENKIGAPTKNFYVKPNSVPVKNGIFFNSFPAALVQIEPNGFHSLKKPFEKLDSWRPAVCESFQRVFNFLININDHSESGKVILLPKSYLATEADKKGTVRLVRFLEVNGNQTWSSIRDFNQKIFLEPENKIVTIYNFKNNLAQNFRVIYNNEHDISEGFQETSFSNLKKKAEKSKINTENCDIIASNSILQTNESMCFKISENFKRKNACHSITSLDKLGKISFFADKDGSFSSNGKQEIIIVDNLLSNTVEIKASDIEKDTHRKGLTNLSSISCVKPLYKIFKHKNKKFMKSESPPLPNDENNLLKKSFDFKDEVNERRVYSGKEIQRRKRGRLWKEQQFKSLQIGVGNSEESRTNILEESHLSSTVSDCFESKNAPLGTHLNYESRKYCLRNLGEENKSKYGILRINGHKYSTSNNFEELYTLNIIKKCSVPLIESVASEEINKSPLLKESEKTERNIGALPHFVSQAESLRINGKSYFLSDDYNELYRLNVIKKCFIPLNKIVMKETLCARSGSLSKKVKLNSKIMSDRENNKQEISDSDLVAKVSVMRDEPELFTSQKERADQDESIKIIPESQNSRVLDLFSEYNFNIFDNCSPKSLDVTEKNQLKITEVQTGQEEDLMNSRKVIDKSYDIPEVSLPSCSNDILFLGTEKDSLPCSSDNSLSRVNEIISFKSLTSYLVKRKIVTSEDSKSFSNDALSHSSKDFESTSSVSCSNEASCKTLMPVASLPAVTYPRMREMSMRKLTRALFGNSKTKPTTYHWNVTPENNPFVNSYLRDLCPGCLQNKYFFNKNWEQSKEEINCKCSQLKIDLSKEHETEFDEQTRRILMVLNSHAQMKSKSVEDKLFFRGFSDCRTPTYLRTHCISCKRRQQISELQAFLNSVRKTHRVNIYSKTDSHISYREARSLSEKITTQSNCISTLVCMKTNYHTESRNNENECEENRYCSEDTDPAHAFNDHDINFSARSYQVEKETSYRLYEQIPKEIHKKSSCINKRPREPDEGLIGSVQRE